MDNIEQIEWFDDRFYKVCRNDGKTTLEDYYPSVTTVLGIIDKPFLKIWYGDQGTERAMYKSKLAKEKGSRIHDGIDQILKKGYLSASGWQQEEYFQLWNFVKFYEALKPKVLFNEQIVLSHEVKSAGTLDMLIEIEDGNYDTGYSKPVSLLRGVYVVDVKTGGFYPEYHYQTAAYANFAIECGLCKYVQGTIILQTNSDTKKNWKCIIRNQQEIESDYQCFLSALHLYNANGADKPKVFTMPGELIIEEIFKLNGDNKNGL